MGDCSQLGWFEQQGLVEMMFLLATLLSSSTLTLAHQYQSDQAQFRTWAEAKAMESCWGEENNRKYLVTMKKAVAKCKQQDAPELELPPFRSSYKFVNYLMNSADSMDQYKMEQMFNAMKIFGRNHPVDYNKYSSFNKYEMVKEMMLKHKMMEFMENYMQAGNSYKNIPYSGDFGYTGHKSMFKHKRDADETLKDIELGDKLVAKINAYRDSMLAEIGNMTCVFREGGMLDNDNKLDIQSMKQKLYEYTLPNDWFKTRFEELIDNCYQIATNLPASIADENVVSGEFGQVNVGQIEQFWKCYQEHHQKLCMDHDTRNKIEENYGPVEDMLDQTGWTERQLLSAFEYLITKENEIFGF